MQPHLSSDSPDRNGEGLVAAPLDPLRYEAQTDHPDEVAGILRSFMPSGVRVLDVGCGTGSVMQVANQGKNNTAIGIEPDAARAECAGARGLEVYCETLTDLFLERHGPFDVIVFSDVLEHLAAPVDLLRTALKGLKSKGLVLASVPNVAHWSVRAQLFFGRFDYADTGIMDSTHLRWFTERSIRALLASAGLETIVCRQSAGVTLPVYYQPPFGLMPGRLRRPLIRLLTRNLPLLFGCQHVVKAQAVM
jgi:methionine biosynthesis protein MetW